MNIEKILNIESCIKNKELIFTFRVNPDVEYTELRMMDFINDFKEILKFVSTNDNIKSYYLIFNMANVKIPSNFYMLQELSDIFSYTKNPYAELGLKKLKYTIMVNSNYYVKLFFSLFKKYYNPFRPLYLCNKDEDVDKCLTDKSFRDTLINLQNEMKKDSL